MNTNHPGGCWIDDLEVGDEVALQTRDVGGFSVYDHGLEKWAIKHITPSRARFDLVGPKGEGMSMNAKGYTRRHGHLLEMQMIDGEAERRIQADTKLLRFRTAIRKLDTVLEPLIRNSRNETICRNEEVLGFTILIEQLAKGLGDAVAAATPKEKS